MADLPPRTRADRTAALLVLPRVSLRYEFSPHSNPSSSETVVIDVRDPQAPWLDHYGLSVPTGSTSTQLAQGAAMPDNGTRASTSSFLSFED